MIAIQRQQLKEFSSHARTRFENEMVVHIRSFFPEHYQALQEAQTRELISYGIEQAAEHQIIAECDVCKFIDLMVTFGPDFCEEGKHAWASLILYSGLYDDPVDKSNALFEAGLEELKNKSRN